MQTFTASKLGEQHGSGMFDLMLAVGVLVLFSTQLGIFEALIRNFTNWDYELARGVPLVSFWT